VAGSVPQQEAGEPAPYRPRKVGPPGPGPAPRRRGRWLDRVIGVVLGLLLGLGVVSVFVFKGSEGTIDAPRISGVGEGQPGANGQPQPGLPLGTRVPLVKVIGGAPPSSGPVRLDFKQGRTARFEVQTDNGIGIQVPGYGVERTLGPGRTLVSFRAGKAGLFPIVVASSHIDVAILHVTRR
jgi:hypothetical protein